MVDGGPSLTFFGFGGMASVKGAICAICMHNRVWKSHWALHAQKPSLAAQMRTAPWGHRASLYLGSARATLPGASSVSCPLLNQ